jgi:hypothetical protein
MDKHVTDAIALVNTRLHIANKRIANLEHKIDTWKPTTTPTVGELEAEIERLECSLAISRGKHEYAIAEIEQLRAALEHCAVARLCTSCEKAMADLGSKEQ